MLALKDKIAAASGKIKVDALFINGRLVNVLSGEIHPANMAVKDGIIVGFGDYEAGQIVDLKGSFITPGLIDGHVHIESSMVTPGQFAKAILPRGTTTVIADPHEIANVCGVDGIRFMLEASEGLALRVYVMLPSCVPATKMETSGAELTEKELAPFLNNSRVLGLGEVMDFPAVIKGEESILKKLLIANGRPIDGHAPGLEGKELASYVMAGVGSEHECTTPQEALERLRLGMRIMVRDGSAAKNLKDLLPVINYHTARRCMLVTDDRHPEDLIKEGHIDHLVRTVIKSGVDPLLAIQMATLNPAEWFGLRDLGALAPGFKADFLVIENLEEFTVREVYVGGKKVAENGRALFKPEQKLDQLVINTVRLPNWSLEDKLSKLKVPGSEEKMPVIGLVPYQIVTEKQQIRIPQQDGQAIPSVDLDLAKIAVFERHRASGRVGVGFLKGLGLKKGAIASSVAHDSHNIVVVGMADEDMALAIQEVEDAGGGIVVVAEGKVLGSISLPIGGLMSEESLENVDEKLHHLHSVAKKLGVRDEYDPFMTLAFLALPVIPEIKISDYGLIDVTEMKIIK